MSEETNKDAAVYNAEAKNRFEFTVRRGDKKYETAHIYSSLSDTRYLQWIDEFKVTGNEDEISEQSREASCRLWDDVIVMVEKIRYPEGADWKSLIDNQEKIDSINQFLAVAIADPETVEDDRLLGEETSQTILTECWFNGEVAQQKHVLKKTNFEVEKKYSRIQGKRFQEERLGGALKRKSKVKYVPQDEKLGELYDEMFISADGFMNDVIPLRFKTQVMHEIFATTLDPKKSRP